MNIFITCLLLISVTPTLAVSSKETQQKIIDYFNEVREAFSIGLQISNMQELSYDIELEQEAKKMYNCDLVKDGKDFNVIRTGSVKKLMEKFDMPDARRIMEDKEALMKDQYFEEEVIPIVHPLDSKIGCVHLVQKCAFLNSESQPMELFA
ncbi:hypothetical protein B9Z55_012250 [Caenorhabditis nigoni]|uniref:SCP domain-containing protein n=1 Tax=Caenorhabditis nigoni TaxID=1611254 RepID=A0A2G5TWC7_9PELO|nr:hypothetical protein B9Z55_012250 [Caenorhabditis nigoni]